MLRFSFIPGLSLIFLCFCGMVMSDNHFVMYIGKYNLKQGQKRTKAEYISIETVTTEHFESTDVPAI